jgi:hypothetical protein
MSKVESGNAPRGVEKFKGFVGTPEYNARQANIDKITQLPPNKLGELRDTVTPVQGEPVNRLLLNESYLVAERQRWMGEARRMTNMTPKELTDHLGNQPDRGEIPNPAESKPVDRAESTTPTPKLEGADREVKKLLSPEQALKAIKERGLFYANVVENLTEEIKNNHPDSESLKEAQLALTNRLVGITETADILTGKESEWLPEYQLESSKWLGDVIQRYSQGKPENK